MAGELESSKSLSGLLSGLAQSTFHGHPGITEELLRSQLYPEVPPEEFRPFLEKMRGLLKSYSVPVSQEVKLRIIQRTIESYMVDVDCDILQTKNYEGGAI